MVQRHHLLPWYLLWCLVPLFQHSQLDLDLLWLQQFHRLLVLELPQLFLLHRRVWLRLGQRACVLPRYLIRRIVPLLQRPQLDLELKWMQLIQHLILLLGVQLLLLLHQCLRLRLGERILLLPWYLLRCLLPLQQLFQLEVEQL